PVLLAVVDHALGAGEYRVVVAHHGAASLVLMEDGSVDGAQAGNHAVGRAHSLQLLEGAALALGGHRQAAVLDEAAGIAEVLDVLAHGPLAGPASACDCVGPLRIEDRRL